MVSVDENLCRKLILTLFLSKLNVPLQVWAVGLNTGLLPSRKSKLGASSMNLSAVRHLSSGGGLHLGKLGLVLELCHQNAHFRSILLGFFNVISCVSKHTVLASEMGRAYRKPPKWLRAGLEKWRFIACFLLSSHLPPSLCGSSCHPFHLVHTVPLLSPAGLPSPLSPKPAAVLSSYKHFFFCIPEPSVSWPFKCAFLPFNLCFLKMLKTKAFISFFCVFCEFLADA